MNRHYFITGATGAVGSALIPYLLEEQDNYIWLLLRADSSEHLEQRLQALMEFWTFDESQRKVIRQRLIPVLGDMDQVHFGMDDQSYHDISKTCSHIIHCAGVVRMNLPLDVATTHAVGSATNVVELALECKKNGQLEKIDFVSTVGVGGRMSTSIPETWITEKREFHNTYEASKAEAEDYLRGQIEKHQLPVTIHRPSMVVGDSKYGKIIHFQIFYHLCEFLSGRRSLGLAPIYDQAILDTVPVDYVAEVLKWSSETPATIGKIFHLSSGPELSIKLTDLRSVVRQRMQAQGIKLPAIITLPSKVFKFTIKLVTPFLNEKVQRAIKVLPIFLDYLTDEQLFANQKTCEFIENNGGPSLPTINTYLNEVLTHYLLVKKS